ncbi:MAG: hypothetical protein ACQET0_05140 [Pseudomonadota bacterium]
MRFIKLSISILIAAACTVQVAVADNQGKATLALIPAGQNAAMADSAATRSEGRVSIRNSRSAESHGQKYTIDLVSDGNVSALDFEINIGGSDGSPQSLNVDGCASGLPDSHMGRCRYHADRGVLKVVVFSMSNAPLPTGSLGEIRVPPSMNAAIEEDSVTLSDGEGQRLDVDVL